LVIDYTLSLAEMVRASGVLVTDRKFTEENFPIDVHGSAVEVEAVLVQHSRAGYYGSDNVLKGLEQRSLQPASHAALLAFASWYPDLSYRFHIVAFGTVGVGANDLPCVALLSHGRLRLEWFGQSWGPHHRFLSLK
jgi:hypothetical protein